MQKDTLLVEFFGMPGVGKSVLSNRISEILSANDISVEQNAYFLSHQVGRLKRVSIKLLRVLKEQLFHPKYAFVSIKTILQTEQKTTVDLVKVIFNWFFVTSLLRNDKHYDGVRLFDEGIFQALWSIGFSGKKGAIASMAPVFSLIPLPALIVVPEASLPTIKSRLSGRERHDSRLENGSEDLLGFAASLFAEVKVVLQALTEQHNGLHLSIVDNESEESLEVNAKKIAVDIESIFKV